MTKFKTGQFVTIGKDIGVIVSFSNSHEIPEEHLAIWYGETTDNNGKIVAKVRTVPEEYCKVLDRISFYH